jgi:heat shock 70kDa protein 4
MGTTYLLLGISRCHAESGLACITLGAPVQVSIVAFRKGQLSVLAHTWDRNLGGRNFDEVMFEHFVKEFDAKYKVDIKSNRRASFRLRLSCEKVHFQ